MTGAADTVCICSKATGAQQWERRAENSGCSWSCDASAPPWLCCCILLDRAGLGAQVGLSHRVMLGSAELLLTDFFQSEITQQPLCQHSPTAGLAAVPRHGDSPHLWYRPKQCFCIGPVSVPAPCSKQRAEVCTGFILMRFV